MSRLLTAVTLFLLSLPVLAATKEMDAASAPAETVDMVWVIVFAVIFIGAIVGFFILAMATPSRERGGEGFSLEIYLAGAAAGAALMLAFAIVPRLLHPKDWPTREEFRRGAEPPKKRDPAP